MSKKAGLAIILVLSVGAVLAALIYHYSGSIAMLNPKGEIALKERDLMAAAILLMLIVVIPVFILTAYICLKYRAGNANAKYTPDWDHNLLAEGIWWGFPLAIITILSVITWRSSHELDPYKPLQSDVKPMTIQVVALEWKWLFIYPEQNIATVNFFQFPVDTPINFDITADAPMNSFWIPQLGGQIYAMPGMKTKLHLIANEAGSYSGSSANLSGKGFAGMTFIAKASSHDDFEKWVESVKTGSLTLDQEGYDLLSKPSSYNAAASFALKEGGLFDRIVMKPMMPQEQTHGKQGTESKNSPPPHHQ